MCCRGICAELNSVPPGALICLGVLALFPANADPLPISWRTLQGVDFLGITTSLAGCVLLTFALESGGLFYPWNNAAIVATCVVAGVCWTGFVVWQWSLSKRLMNTSILPLFPVRLATDRIIGFTLLCVQPHKSSREDPLTRDRQLRILDRLPHHDDHYLPAAAAVAATRAVPRPSRHRHVTPSPALGRGRAAERYRQHQAQHLVVHPGRLASAADDRSRFDVDAASKGGLGAAGTVRVSGYPGAGLWDGAEQPPYCCASGGRGAGPQ